MNELRQLIRIILEKKQKKKLITEPDKTNGRDSDKEDEASVSSSVAGVTTPLGTGPTYPSKRKDKRQKPEDVAGRAFGNAKRVK